MKKGLLLIVILLALLGAAAAPYWFGMQAEHAYDELLQQAARDGRFTVSNAHYERGWLVSTADATITPSALPLGVTVTSTIHHGPFPLIGELQWTAHTALVTSQIGLPFPPGLPPLTARTLIHLDRQSETRLELPAHKHAWPEGGGVEWQAGSGEFSASGEARRVKASFVLPALEIRSSEAHATFTRLGLNVDRRPAPSGLSLVDFSMSLDRLAASGPQGKPTLAGLRLGMGSEESAGTLSLSFNFEFRELNDGEAAYGPAQLTLKLGKLDSALLAKYQQQLTAAESAPAAEQQAMIGKTLELVAGLARKAPELELTRLSLKTPGGEISGSGKLVLDGGKLDVAENPMLLLSALNGEGKILVPNGVVKALAEKDIRRKIDELKAKGSLSEQEAKKLTPEKLAQVSAKMLPRTMDEVARGHHLVPDGLDYKLNATFKQGRLLVNGKPLEQPLRLAP